MPLVIQFSATTSTNCNHTDNMPVKKEAVAAGTTIHREKPFVCVLSAKYRSECCDFCFTK